MTIADLQKDQEFIQLSAGRGQGSVFRFVGKADFDEMIEEIRAGAAERGFSDYTEDLIEGLAGDFYKAIWVEDLEDSAPIGLAAWLQGDTEVELRGRG